MLTKLFDIIWINGPTKLCSQFLLENDLSTAWYVLGWYTSTFGLFLVLRSHLLIHCFFTSSYILFSLSHVNPL